MKFKEILLFLMLATPLLSISQEIVLKPIQIPGEQTQGIIVGYILGENLFGPCSVFFSGEETNLKRENKNSKSHKYGINTTEIDIMPVTFSGKIYSPGVPEPFVFENKSPEELKAMEITIFPATLEMPYTLYVDLSVHASSKPTFSKKSDDAGLYKGKININLKNQNK